MTTYNITVVYEREVWRFTVKASNETEARDKAHERIPETGMEVYKILVEQA